MDINNRSLEVDAFWEGRQHVSAWGGSATCSVVFHTACWGGLSRKYMESFNTDFGPNYQSVCPVSTGHLQQALPVLHVDTSCGLTLEGRQTCWPPPWSASTSLSMTGFTWTWACRLWLGFLFLHNIILYIYKFQHNIVACIHLNPDSDSSWLPAQAQMQPSDFKQTCRTKLPLLWKINK